MGLQRFDVLEVTVIHDNANTGEQVNRYQLQSQDTLEVDNADLLDDIADWMEIIYGAIEALITVRNVLREVTVYNVTQSLLVGSTDGGAYIGGIATGDDIPQGACPFAYFKTEIPRVILSKYLPTGVEGQTGLEGELTVAGLGLVTDYVAELMVDQVMAHATLRYGYLSPKTLGFEIPTLGITTSVLAYQRRRKKGRGS